MEHRATADRTRSAYREFAPRAELREHVRAIAWYGPAAHAPRDRAAKRNFELGNDVALTPTFADSQVSLLFPVGFRYRDGAWEDSAESGGTVLGPVTHVTQPEGTRSAMLGIYLRPGAAAAFLDMPLAEITDGVAPLEGPWKKSAIPPERITLDAVEALLMRRLSRAKVSGQSTHIARLALHVTSAAGAVSVTEMSQLTGTSRQHLRRLFLRYVGVSPKLFARLARFRAALGAVPQTARGEAWSRIAFELGYADQSHLIAEFREFAGLSPGQLTPSDRFHPFVGDEG